MKELFPGSCSENNVPVPVNRPTPWRVFLCPPLVVARLAEQPAIPIIHRNLRIVDVFIRQRNDMMNFERLFLRACLDDAGFPTVLAYAADVVYKFLPERPPFGRLVKSLDRFGSVHRKTPVIPCRRTTADTPKNKPVL